MSQPALSHQLAALTEAWSDAGRAGAPEVHVIIAAKPSPDDLAAWAECGVTDLIWGLPDKSADEVIAFIGRHAERPGLGG